MCRKFDFAHKMPRVKSVYSNLLVFRTKMPSEKGLKCV
ncbi:hypothetical protein NM36_2085 [Neisseria meningitidis NM36]|nr:hypothetical protein NM36_2085 [Neisseria meningitidis NM36]